MKRAGFVLAAAFCMAVMSSTASAVTYYSQASGTQNPNTLTNWNSNRLGGGTNPANFTSGDTFVIQGTGNGGTSPHSVTTNTAWSISGASSKLQIENGATLQSDATITLAAATTFQIDSGGNYIHNNLGPIATTIYQGIESFGLTSNFEIRRWGALATSSATSINSSQTASVVSGGNSYFYGNLTINTTAYTGIFSTGLTGTVRECAGNLTLTSTGTSTTGFRFATAGTPTVFILGDYSQATGTNVDGSSGVGLNLNLGGNFSLAGTADLDDTGSGFVTISFIKSSGTQTVNVSSSANHPWVIWTVGDGTTTNTVQLLNSINLTGGLTGRRVATITVSANAVLDLNGFILRIEGSTTGNVAIAGTLQGTAASSRLLFSSSGTSTTTLSGAGTINGGNLTVEYNHTGTGINLIGRNLTIFALTVTAGNVLLNNTATQRIINLTNFSMAAGTLDTGSVNVTGNVTAIVTLTGNFSKTGGTITNTSSLGIGTFVFTGGGPAQTWANAGTFQFTTITVNNSSSLTLTTAMAFSGISGPLLTVDLGSTVTAGTQLISTSSASGSFVVNGTLRTANTVGLNGAATTTFVSTNAPTVTLGGSSTIEYNGVAAQIITGRLDYATLTLNNSAGGTLNGNTTVGTALNASVGIFDQGASFNLISNTVTVTSSATWRNVGTGDVTLSGNVANAGTITFNGTTTTCGEADAILIRSSVPGTQRQWNGAGTFNMTDVDVQDQAGTAIITAFSSTNSGNNGANWIIISGCTAGGTYTWNPAVGGDWNLAANWTPARAVKLSTDILIINTGFTPIITNVAIPSPETIATLRILNGTLVTMSAPIGGGQLNIAGGSPSDLQIDAGSSLTFAGASDPLTINVAGGSTGAVSGLITMQDGAHQLLATGDSTITFTGLNAFTTAPNYSSATHPFGTGVGVNGSNNSIIFTSGTTYTHQNGASPFGNPGPVVVFQTGSLARYYTSNGFDADGRTYADLTIGDGTAAVTASDSGTGNFQFDNLIVNSTGSANSSLTYNGSGTSTITIRNNITSNGVGNGGTLPDVTLTAGSGGIVINNPGETIVFTNDGSNTRAVQFESSGSVGPTTELLLNRKLLVGMIQPSSLVLTIEGVLNGSATGYVIGNVRRPVPATPDVFIFHVGTPNGYSPLDATITSIEEVGDSLTVAALQGSQPVLNPATSLQRYWRLTEDGGITADLLFHYNHPPDVAGNEANYRLVIVEGGVATQFPENCPNVACVDESADTIRRNGATVFSDWTAAEPNAPTAVKLTGFSATRSNDEVTLEWQTGYEAHNLGYNIYREQDGKRVQITPSLVAGSALIAGRQTNLTAGLSYTWKDEGTVGSGQWAVGSKQSPEGSRQKAGSETQNSELRTQNSPATYWLEDIDLDGTRTLHGPIAVEECGTRKAGCKQNGERSALFGEVANPKSAIRNAQSRSGVHFSGWPAASSDNLADQRTEEKIRNRQPSPIEVQRRIAGLPGVKVAVSKPGWYRVTKAEMQAAGLDTKEAYLLQLFVGGVEVPISLSGDGQALTANDYLEFYGQGLDSPTDAAQTYYLIVGKAGGKRVNARSDSQISEPTDVPSFAYTIERKERMIYFSGLLNGESENFFGRIVSTTAASATIPVNHLDEASTASAQLELTLQGVTSQSHLVQVLFNGTDLGTVNFANTEHTSQTFEVPASALQEGDNTVQLTSLGGAADVSLVDTMRLTYAHTYVADPNALSFTIANQQTRRVTGFSSQDIRVVDITDPYNVDELKPAISELKSGNYAADIQVPRAGYRRPHRLLVFTGDYTAPADRVEPNDASAWWAETAGADYLIITTRELMASVVPLAQLRRAQGLVVQVVDVEDLYDEFSFGKHSPHAIHDFLEGAMNSWTRKPHYLLLAGDASYDPKNYFGQGLNDLVPTRLIDTALTETASDDWLADFNGDGMADLAVGRLPVRTVTETNALVTKIVSYENAAPDPTRGALLVADNNFEAPSSAVQGQLPAGMAAQVINRNSADDASIHNQIITAINQGPLVANYIGHGSNGVWTGASLLSSNDAPGLTNVNRLSVFTMMTCFNGFFQDAYNESLSEALLKSPGGAVAVWASTTMTEPSGQNAIDLEFYRLLFGAQPLTLGDAARAAKVATTDADVRRTWTLLGDPAMRLR